MTTLLGEATPKARKPHYCECCCGIIEPGAFYLRQRCADGSEAWTFKAHFACSTLWSRYGSPHEWVDDSWIRDALEEVTAEQLSEDIDGLGADERRRALWFWISSRREIRNDETLLRMSLLEEWAQAAGVELTAEDRTKFAGMVAERFNDLGDEDEAVFYVDDRGHEHRTRTGSRAWALGGHTPVVLLHGVSGAYMLERVTPCWMREGEES